MVNDAKKTIEKLFYSLDTPGLIKAIVPTTNFFNDEPKMFLYHATFHNIKNVAGKNDSFRLSVTDTAGTSFSSKENAFLKCLAEGIERICLFDYDKSKIKYFSSENLARFALEKTFNKEKIGWVKGFDLINNKEDFIPAQLTSLFYLHNNRKEPFLSVNISTGTAFEFDLTSALIKGLHETIERDALMTIYLDKISVPHIKLETIPDKRIKELILRFKRYNLEWYVFDFVNDFNIPVSLSLLVDRSGYGPAVSFGAKCSFDKIHNILSSVEEAVMVRDTARRLLSEIYTGKLKKLSFHDSSLFYRINLWWPVKMLEKLNFLLKSPKISFKQSRSFINKKAELDFIISSIKEKGYDVFYKDITMDYFKKKGFFVIRVVMPALQPLYLAELGKKIIEPRLKEVAKYHKVKFVINDIPHPFL